MFSVWVEFVYRISSSEKFWILVEYVCYNTFLFSSFYIDDVAPAIGSEYIPIEIVGSESDSIIDEKGVVHIGSYLLTGGNEK